MKLNRRKRCNQLGNFATNKKRKMEWNGMRDQIDFWFVLALVCFSFSN